MRVKNMPSKAERLGSGGEGSVSSWVQGEKEGNFPWRARLIRPKKEPVVGASPWLPPSGSPLWCPAMAKAAKGWPCCRQTKAPAVAWSTLGPPRRRC